MATDLSAAPAPVRDPQLWLQARAQAKFKSHLFVYLTVNALLWALWAVSGRESDPLPWPVFSSLFWGFGLVMQGLRTYGALSPASLTEREYQRLLAQRDGLQ
jgi:hypothetical protein